MPFSNPIVGLEELIRSAIKSKDYVAGVTGWRIARDGSAEFSSIIIRGSGTSDAVTVGPSGGIQVVVRTTPTNGLIAFPTHRAIEQLAATVTAAVVNSGAANERAEFQVTGPTVSGSTEGVRLILMSQPNDGTDVARFSVQNKDGSEIFFTVDKTEIHAKKMVEREAAASTDTAYSAYVTNDSFDRFRILANGEHQWGSGAAAREVKLYRAATNVLQTDNTFVVLGEFDPRNLVRGERTNPTDSQYETRATGEGFARWFCRADGLMFWGPGNAVQDTNLYRGGNDLLKTDGDFDAANYPAGAWTSFTPSWTTSNGLHVPSFGNATLNCEWTRAGKTITARYEIVFGGTTNFGVGATTSDNWRIGLPVTASAMHQVGGFFELNQSTGGRCIARARFTTTSALELEIASGRVDAVAITNDGLVDSLSPWTWASGNAVRGIVQYEAA